MLIISCGSAENGGATTGRDCRTRTDGLVWCVYTILFYGFLVMKLKLYNIPTHTNTHAHKLVCSTCVIHNKSLKRRQRSDCDCCCCCCFVVAAVLLLLLLLFVLLAGIFTQLFYMLRDSKKSEKTKIETKAVQKNCWRLGLKDIESEGTRHGVE